MSVGGTRYQSDLQMDGATMNRAVPEPLWTPTDVATYLGIPVQTLYQWRRKAPGLKVTCRSPPKIRIERRPGVVPCTSGFNVKVHEPQLEEPFAQPRLTITTCEVAPTLSPTSRAQPT